jgi:hypothetical protein
VLIAARYSLGVCCERRSYGTGQQVASGVSEIERDNRPVAGIAAPYDVPGGHQQVSEPGHGRRAGGSPGRYLAFISPATLAGQAATGRVVCALIASAP